jgi:hypothetical protein
MGDIYGLGIGTLIANALVAFLLNASVVLLVSRFISWIVTTSLTHQ